MDQFSNTTTVGVIAGVILLFIVFIAFSKPAVPPLAAFLSLILPGLGQIYNRQIWQAVFWIVITPALWVGTGGLLGWICHVIAAYSAYTYAKRRAVSPQLPEVVTTGREFMEEQPRTQYVNLKNIRTLLTEGFTDEELRRLCYDMPEFRPVYDQLARNSGKAEIVDRLLEYAERTLQIESLLDLAKEYNLARYEKHQPYY